MLIYIYDYVRKIIKTKAKRKQIERKRKMNEKFKPVTAITMGDPRYGKSSAGAFDGV